MASGRNAKIIEAGAGEVLHATSVAICGRGVLIRGSSGSGKSRLALELIALGAVLVADDRAILTPTRHSGRRKSERLCNGDEADETDAILLSPPDTIAGLIEARGIGILRMPYMTDVPLELVVDLDLPAHDRLPAWESARICGREIVMIRGSNHPFLAAALHCYCKGERVAPEPAAGGKDR